MTELIHAKKIKRSEFAGIGMWYQLVGLILCCTVIGALIGIPLLIVGGRKAIVYKCSNCMNKVDKEARMCPVCRADLQY